MYTIVYAGVHCQSCGVRRCRLYAYIEVYVLVYERIRVYTVVYAFSAPLVAPFGGPAVVHGSIWMHAAQMVLLHR